MKGLRLAVVVAMLAWCSDAFALNPALEISQYAHTAWRMREGFAASPINAIAQTVDGYLWLGTDFGLFRFDGVRAVLWQPPGGQRLPSTEIWSVLGARDGSLWIGTAKGLVRLQGERLSELPEFAGHYVYKLLEARDGSVWAGSIMFRNAKVCELGTPVECHGGGGRFGNAVVGLHEDPRGRVWAGVVDGVWELTASPARFHTLPGFGDQLQAFTEFDGGTLITADVGLRRFVNGNVAAYPWPGPREIRPQRLLRDRDGGLWIGTSGGGLAHLHQGRTDYFGMADGLSGDAIHALFEDREGSVWVATVNGLDRFRDVVVATLGSAQGISNSTAAAVVTTRDGTLWFGANGALNQWTASRWATVPIDGNANPIPTSLFEDRRGQFWVSTITGTGYFENGRFTNDARIPGGAVHAIGDDAAGGVWIANQDAGMFRVDPGGSLEHVPWERFGRQDFATAVAADPGGAGIWVGFHEGGLVHFRAGGVRASYSSADRLGNGRVNAVWFDRNGALWAATAGGLSRLRGGRLATLNSRNGLPCDGVHWAIEDDAQSMWVFMPCGLVRLPIAELHAWIADVDRHGDSTRTFQPATFDIVHGVMTRAYAGGFTPQVTRTADGRIWYSTNQGLSVLDPRRIPFNATPPPVHIEQVTADHQPYPVPPSAAAGPLRLPALTRDLQIDYTALSLIAPEKMQFRYLLEGYDREWQEAGNRRQAFYTNLPPREYRFRVVAANNDGVWNETGAMVSFVVAPAYYQTTWFAAFAIAAVAAAVWVTHRIRLRIVERHQREVTALNERLMGAQEQERIRIAGELHDSVMQEMLAATMMLGATKRRSGESETRATIEKVQDKLVQVGNDIRQLSHDLHPPVLQDRGLPEALRMHCAQFSAGCGVPVSCDADDAADELSRGAALALFRIVQEALGNAAKHAKAREIRVRLARTGSVVTLVVADDGVGFDRARLTEAGGLGLVTMRERATQLNGTFEFDSVPGRGTTITVTIPFR